MKTKAFEPGAICAAAVLLLVLSLPAYAESGRSSAAQTRVGNASTNATGGVRPVTSSKVQTTNETKKIKSQLSPVRTQIGEILKANARIEGKQAREQERIKVQGEKSGNIQKNLGAAQEANKAINCIANC
jgi:hypothetical protein